MWDSIPLDIQVEIIKRITDIKSLIRLRCVSKTWKSLIGSSQFINHHTQHQQQHHLLVSYDVDLHYIWYNSFQPNFKHRQKYLSMVDDDSFCQHEFTLTLDVPLPFNEFRKPSIIGSSHGLVCVYSWYRYQMRGRYKMKETAVIWNPKIRKSIDIAVPMLAYAGVVGFGVCPRTLDPKLVKFSWSVDHFETKTNPWQVKVFTLSSGLWRSPLCIHNLPRKLRFKSEHVVADGFIYWLSYQDDYISEDGEIQQYYMIMSFDIITEEFIEVYLPNSLAAKNGLVISSRMDSLVVIERNFELMKHFYGVWKMEHGVTKTFTKLFNICTPHGILHRVHGFRNNGEPIIEVTCIQFQKRGLYAYEPSSGRIKFAGIDGKRHIHCVTSYMETLLLLDI